MKNVVDFLIGGGASCGCFPVEGGLVYGLAVFINCAQPGMIKSVAEWQFDLLTTEVRGCAFYFDYKYTLRWQQNIDKIYKCNK